LILQTQIRSLVASLNKKTVRGITAELHAASASSGSLADFFILRCLLDAVDVKEGDSSKSQKDQLKVSLLSSEFDRVLRTDPNFVSIIVALVGDSSAMATAFVSTLRRTIKLSRWHEVCLAFALAQSHHAAIARQAVVALKAMDEVKALLADDASLSKAQTSSLTDLLTNLPPDALHALLLYVLDNPNDFGYRLGVSTPLRNAVAGTAAFDFLVPGDANVSGGAHVPGLAPLEPVEPSALLANLGCSQTASSEVFQTFLRETGLTSLTEASVARLLGVMVRVPPSGSGDSSTGISLDIASDAPGAADAVANDSGNNNSKKKGAQKGGANGWNVNILMDVALQHNPKLRLDEVMEQLDHPGFRVPDQRGFNLLVAAFKRARPKDVLPLGALLSKVWTNRRAQLDLLRYALRSPGSIAPIVNASQRLTNADGLPTNTTGKNGQQALPMVVHWRSVELVETLLMLSTAGDVGECRALFQFPLKYCPSILLVSLSQVGKSYAGNWDGLYEELLAKTLAIFLQSDNASNGPVISRLWSTNKTILVHGLTGMYTVDPHFVGRALHIAQDQLRSLPVVLQLIPDDEFAVDLAAIAAKRGFLNVETWFGAAIKARGESFVSASAAFVRRTLDDGSVATVTQEVLLAVARAVAASQSGSAQLKDVEGALKKLTIADEGAPAGGNAAAGAAAANGGTAAAAAAASATGAASSGATAVVGGEKTFSPEIEETANGYFHKIYTGQMAIADILELLKFFKSSPDSREQDVYAAMIHNLFDEYRFFPKYPEKELKITGVLFGSLIQHQLVAGQSLGVALRYVLDGLRSESGSKMFMFGLIALEHFRERLSEWPQYVTHLRQIPSIAQHHASLWDFINLIKVDSSAPSTMPGNMGKAPTTTSTSPMSPALAAAMAAASETARLATRQSGPLPVLDLDKVIRVPASLEIVRPPVVVEEKISFAINNLTEANLPSKLADIHALVAGSEQCQEWMAAYLVAKRISVEANFHALYLRLVEGLKLPSLMQYLRIATHSRVKSLIGPSGKVDTDASERQLLKNLGGWLGMVTIGQSRPILATRCSLKQLLFHAYEQGRLTSILPYVCKVLSSASRSRIFRPPNPWTMNHMRLLAALYRLPGLRLNLKFEIEVLCRTLSLNLDTLQPSTAFANRRRLATGDDVRRNDAASTGTTPYQASASGQAEREPAVVQGGAAAASQEMPAAAVEAAAVAAQAAATAGGESPTKAGTEGVATPAATTTSVAALAALRTAMEVATSERLKISPNIVLFQTQPQFRRFVQPAVERALKDICIPVVERTSTISMVSTRDLVLKDYATEPNEQSMRRAAHWMVTALARSYASVTCRDALRASMISNLRNMFTSGGASHVSGSQVFEQAIQTIVTDNMDWTCAVVEQAAVEKAVALVDEQLAPALSARATHRASGSLEPFIDKVAFAGLNPVTLPDALRPLQGGPLSHSRQVYEEFANMARGSHDARTGSTQAAASSAGGGRADGDEGVSADGGAAGRGGRGGEGGAGDATELAPVKVIVAQFQAICAKLDDACQAAGHAASFSTIPPDHEVHTLWRSAAAIVNQAQDKNEAVVAVAQRLFLRLIEAVTRLRLETNLAALDALCRVSPELPRQLTKWLLVLPNDARFRRDVALPLMRHGLVRASEVDVELAQGVAKGQAVAVDVAAHAVADASLVGRMENTLAALHALSQKPGAPEELRRLVAEGRRQAASAAAAAASGAAAGMPEASYRPGDDPGGLLLAVSEEWSKLQANNAPAAEQNAFVMSFRQRGLLRGEESSSRFFRVLCQLAVDAHTQGKDATPFAGADAFARLVVVLLQMQDPKNMQTQVNLLNGVLSVFVRVLFGQAESSGTLFDSRPYHRILVHWLEELGPSEAAPEGLSLHLLGAFGNALVMLHPGRVPSFAFAWLELVAHPRFMPKLLCSKGQKGWPLFERLLVDFLGFLAPFLRACDLTEPIGTLYRATMRILLVLLHDFPEFLCGYHVALCDVIPPVCVQMRNLILSAYPRTLRLPDPLAKNIKIDLLPEMSNTPRILLNFATIIPAPVKAAIESFITSGRPASLPTDLGSRLVVAAGATGQAAATGGSSTYNIPLVNAVVLFVAAQAIALGRSTSTSPMSLRAPIDVFQGLMDTLDAEGRYYVLSAAANQLRFPNEHTHFFSFLLLHLFAEARHEFIREQVTRVLLERLLANRPHPWGLMVTFLELIKNSRYRFWDYSFVTLSPEIEKVFTSVARSIFGANK
jgi:CCR4-NOT transcription complex subunit 1